MNRKQKVLLIRIVIALLLFILALFIGNLWIKYSFLGISYILVGYSVILKAAKRIIKGKFFDENFLMMIATFGAIAIGEYLEATAVMLFYQIGEFFQGYAVGKSRKSISNLMDICPEYVNLEQDGKIEVVDPYEVSIGDIIIIKPGEKVPLDGIIISGETSLNTAALTGESVPRDVFEGDRIISGVINLTGLIRVRVEKEFSDSTVSKILELVENSSFNKAKTENFITRFSIYYTPIVVISAICLAVIPPIFLGGISNWIYRALIFLVVSCPCALVISVPLSFFGGIGGASRNGILIKGPSFLEHLANCKTFIFDKTGTLTKGEFKVTSINPVGVSEKELIETAIIAESGSNHPIAQAVIREFGATNCQAGIKEISGKGVLARLDNNEILAGNIKLLQEENIEVSPILANGAVIYVALNKKFIGTVVVSDSVKENGKDALKNLFKLGIKNIVMLTGDNKNSAKIIGEELGISNVKAELLPQDKAEEVSKIIAENKGTVAFVGDGINDAPVLALSDVGIAMGGIGSDAAIEAADVVLMDDNLAKIPIAVKISRKTMRIVRQNIVFAIGVKGLVLIMGAFGIANMWGAVFADVGVAFVAILNAMRTLRKHNK